MSKRARTTPLEHCVFCKRDDRVEDFEYETQYRWVFIVKCWSCGAQGPNAGNAEAARQLWNTLHGGARR